MNTSLAAAFDNRITALTPKIARQSRYIASFAPGLDPEDIQQTLYLKILEKAQADPDFLNQPDVHLLTFTNWRGRSFAELARIYTRYVWAEDFVADEDGDEISFFELIPSSEISPEEHTIQSEIFEALSTAISQFDARDQQIVRMLTEGYTQVEIAAEFGVTRQAICLRLSAIRQRLAEIVSVPA